MTLRGVGIDVADVARVARLLDTAGDRFARRWFTEAEIAECTASPEPAQAYATRFAAKEAVWKALAVEWDGPLPWPWIAVLEGETLPRVELSGDVAAAAAQVGVASVLVTLTVDGGLATAVALAELGSTFCQIAPLAARSVG